MENVNVPTDKTFVEHFVKPHHQTEIIAELVEINAPMMPSLAQMVSASVPKEKVFAMVNVFIWELI